MKFRVPSAGLFRRPFTKRHCRSVALVSLLCVPFAVFAGESGKLTEEVWLGISGDSMSTLTSEPRFPTSPTSVSKIVGVEPSQNIGDNYGRRLRGWITAPATGDYTFWLADDDNCEFWLSTDDAPDNRRLIAEVTGPGCWTGFRQFDRFPSQRSASITLV